MFIHVGAVWHVNVNYQKAQQPPEPGHASDHYCFLPWTKSESGRQAASIPWKLELAAVVFFSRQLTLSNSCPSSLVMESIYELSRNVPRLLLRPIPISRTEFLISIKLTTYIYTPNQELESIFRIKRSVQGSKTSIST